MFNLKDTPASTGFTLLTAGFIALTLPVERVTRLTNIAGWFATFGGALVIWGVRPGLWPALALAFFAMLLVRARLNNFSHWKKTLTAIIYPASAVAAAYAIMILIYPYLFRNPFRFLYQSINETATFAHNTVVLTNGVFLGVPPPWYYFPQWLAAQLPEVLLVLLVVAVGLAVWLVLRRLFRSRPSRLDFVFPAMVYVFIQLAAFIVAAILLGSPVYHGIRQFLFVIPAVAMLIMLSLFVLVRHWPLQKIRGLWPAVAGLLVVSTLATTFTQVQMFPYSVSYFNPVTVAGGVDGRWDVYARKLAVGELYAQLTTDERLRCTKNCPEIESLPRRFLEAATTESTPLQYWEVIQFPPNVATDKPAKACHTPIHSVTRPYFSASISMLSATVCDIAGTSIDSSPATADDNVKRWKRLTQWGWEKEQPNGVTSVPGVSSALAWSVESWTPGTTLRYVLELSILDGSAEFVTVSPTVNGVPRDSVTIAAGGQTDLVLEVPVPTTQGAPEDLVVVEFVLSDSNGVAVTNRLVVHAIRSAL
jgi:hypothetical protein